MVHLIIVGGHNTQKILFGNHLAKVVRSKPLILEGRTRIGVATFISEGLTWVRVATYFGTSDLVRGGPFFWQVRPGPGWGFVLAGCHPTFTWGWVEKNVSSGFVRYPRGERKKILQINVQSFTIKLMFESFHVSTDKKWPFPLPQNQWYPGDSCHHLEFRRNPPPHSCSKLPQARD